MLQFWAVLGLLVDPRGRLTRSGFLVGATAALCLWVIAGFQSVDDVSSLSFWMTRALPLWMILVCVIKRLHDADRSGWWILAGLGGSCIWMTVVGFTGLLVLGNAAFLPGSVSATILAAILGLPIFGMVLWLHLIPGDAYRNLYGPVSAGGHLGLAFQRTITPAR